MTPSSPVAAFRPYHVLMSLVFSVALAAGWTMLPGQAERVAMLERDGKSKDALELLESAYASGDRSYRTLNHMLTLYDDQGELSKARKILQAMTEQWPRDVALRRRLASFNRNEGKGADRLAALKSQIELRYNEAACREYISLLRLSGSTEEEMAAIRGCRQKGYRRADDLARLSALAAADGDKELASSLLKSIDDVRRLREVDERFQLIALLLDQNQPREAARRAVRWINAGKDHVLAVGLIDLFARSKFPESAVDVAKEAGQAGDSISLTVAERLIEQGQIKPAGLYLRGWLDNALFENEDVISRFIDAAAEVRDPALAFAGARKFGLGRLQAQPAQRLVDTLTLASMKREIDEVRAAAVSLREPVPEKDGASTTAEAGKSAAAVAPLGAPTFRRVTLVQGDELESWRRSLWSRLNDDAIRKARSLGLPPPRPGVREGYRAQGHTNVLKKTSRVLQRTKKLKSLKIKQRLVREGARARAKKP